MKLTRVAATSFVVSSLVLVATYALTSLIFYFDWYDRFGKYVYSVLYPVVYYGAPLVWLLSLAVLMYIVVSSGIRNIRSRSR